MTRFLRRRFIAICGTASFFPAAAVAQQQGSSEDADTFFIRCSAPQTTIRVQDHEIIFSIRGRLVETAENAGDNVFDGVVRIPLSGQMAVPGDTRRDVHLYLAFDMAEQTFGGRFRFPRGWSGFRLRDMVIDFPYSILTSLPEHSSIPMVRETFQTSDGVEVLTRVDDSYQLRSRTNFAVPFTSDLRAPEAGVVDLFTTNTAFDKEGNEIRIPVAMEAVAEAIRGFADPIFAQARAALDSGNISQAGVKIGDHCVSDAHSDSNCFLTTATVGCVGLPDDCFELRTLRHFRDRHLSTTSEGTRLVEEYYGIAPRIVDAVNARPEAAAIWRRTYRRYVLPCAILARLGLRARAIRRYRKMVAELSGYVAA